jgi:hypothetical protein
MGFFNANAIHMGISALTVSIILMDSLLHYLARRWSSHRSRDVICVIFYLIVLIYQSVNAEYIENPWIRLCAGLRSLILFRLIEFHASLNVVVEALVKTASTKMFDALIFLILTLLVSAVIGYYIFGLENVGPAFLDWSNLNSAILTLMVYISGDGWRPFHDRLVESGYDIAYLFSPVAFIVGNLIVAKYQNITKHICRSHLPKYQRCCKRGEE